MAKPGPAACAQLRLVLRVPGPEASRRNRVAPVRRRPAPPGVLDGPPIVIAVDGGEKRGAGAGTIARGCSFLIRHAVRRPLVRGRLPACRAPAGLTRPDERERWA
jgi:hypothetical protein